MNEEEAKEYWERVFKRELPLSPLPESVKMYGCMPSHVEPLPAGKEEIEKEMKNMFDTYNDAEWWKLDY
jgi:hypothetical protein